MNGLFIQWHLGLGDAIISNAIVRHFAKLYPLIVLPVKYHNVPSVQFMLRDLENVLIRPVEDDAEQIMFAERVWECEVLRIGGWGIPDGRLFDPGHWDRSFYEQGGLPFDLRWSGWKCKRDITSERGFSFDGPYMFLHDDPTRGFQIDLKRVWGEKTGLRIEKPTQTQHIFQWWNIVEHAEEIHCIPSSFAHWIDSIDLPKNPRLFLHAYTRKGEPLAIFKKNWEILR